MFFYMARFGDGPDIYLGQSDTPKYHAARRDYHRHYLDDDDINFYVVDEWCNQETATEWTVPTRITEKFYKYLKGGVRGSGGDTRLVRMNMYFNTGGQPPAILSNPPLTSKLKYYLAHFVELDNMIYVCQSQRKYPRAWINEGKVVLGNLKVSNAVPLHRIDKEVVQKLRATPSDAKLWQLSILAEYNLL